MRKLYNGDGRNAQVRSLQGLCWKAPEGETGQDLDPEETRAWRENVGSNGVQSSHITSYMSSPLWKILNIWDKERNRKGIALP